MGLSFGRRDTLCEKNGPLENASSARGKFEKSPASKFKRISCLAKGRAKKHSVFKKEKGQSKQSLFFSSVSGPQRLVPLPAARLVSTGLGLGTAVLPH